jgi:hypothetical protein
MASPNADGFAALDRMIAKTRAIPGLVKEVAPEIARVVGVELKQNIDAGRAPDGTPWEPTKEGGRPLVNASKHVTVRAVGTVIVVRLTGAVEVKHHLGRVKGGVRRQIIPTRKTAGPILRLAKRLTLQRFREAGAV